MATTPGKAKKQYIFSTAYHPPACVSGTTLIYPTPSNPSPPTNHPIFTHALSVRHKVFVLEQNCSPDAERDADDVRSWEWVVYASPLPSSEGNEKEEEGEKIPVAVTRLVPPPHFHHEQFADSHTETTTATATATATETGAEAAGDGNGNEGYDYSHEPYVKITRVAVLREFRGYGLARLLMNAVEEWAARNKAEIDEMYNTYSKNDKTGGEKEWNGLIGLHAQVQVEQMYASLGYVTDVSMGTWEEERMKHVGMFKRLQLRA